MSGNRCRSKRGSVDLFPRQWSCELVAAQHCIYVGMRLVVSISHLVEQALKAVRLQGNRLRFRSLLLFANCSASNLCLRSITETVTQLLQWMCRMDTGVQGRSWFWRSAYCSNMARSIADGIETTMLTELPPILWDSKMDRRSQVCIGEAMQRKLLEELLWDSWKRSRASRRRSLPKPESSTRTTNGSGQYFCDRNSCESSALVVVGFYK